MLRFTSLALLVACAAPAQTRPPPTAAITNQQSITRYQLPEMHVPPIEGPHSAHHTTMTLSGSLELIGTGDSMIARIALASISQTSYVGCPGGTPWDGSTRQACVTSVPPGAEDPQHTTLVLTGPAQWRGEQLHIEMAKEIQPNPARAPYTLHLALACTSDDTGGLACSVEDRDYTPLWHVDTLRFVRAPHAQAPRAAQR
jgi:hypothetical protein